ncbi:MAG: DUF366 family protein [Planctomycetota bacterium]
MNTRWIEDVVRYDGSQLAPHWILRETGLVGDALVAFRGPCAVATAQMADLEDALSGSSIAGSDMIHFLCEMFDDGDLGRAVLRQRLLAATALEVLRRRSPGLAAHRDGDDLYCDGRKLSISIASRSLVSSLIHFAVNVDPAGAPVAAAGLVELGVEPEAFARDVLDASRREHESMRAARCQVRPRFERGS